jgi:hypothetical protein
MVYAIRSPRRVWLRPRPNRKAATISQIVTFENPESASRTVIRRSSIPAVMTTIIRGPAGSGRAIRADTVAAKRHRSPQLRGSKPACGRTQTAAAVTSGTARRQRSVLGVIV